MRTKTERIHIRVAHGTKMVWLDLCRILDGGTQSENFEFIVMTIAKNLIDKGKFIIPKIKQEDGN